MKYCKDCEHYFRPGPFSDPHCAATERVCSDESMIYGKREYAMVDTCEWARTSGHLCGPKATKFKPKVAVNTEVIKVSKIRDFFRRFL